MINKLVVIGVGLIGGSFALALKRAGLVGEVVGVGRSAENLQRALQLKVIDTACQDAEQAVIGADYVFIATPVGQMAEVMQAIAPNLSATAIITDGGSTKRDVVELYRRHLAAHLPRCVPAHPIAGSDLSGAAAARYGLYEGKQVVLTPLPETNAEALATVRQLWAASGASLSTLSPDAHDSVFASVSHLPHLLAFAYMNTVLAKPDAPHCLALAGSGFRDFTRIAGSHPEMWRDIALTNRELLLQDLARFQEEIAKLVTDLREADGEALLDAFSAASAARVAWQKGK